MNSFEIAFLIGIIVIIILSGVALRKAEDSRDIGSVDEDKRPWHEILDEKLDKDE